MYLAFVIGFLGLCGQAYLSYSENLKSQWFYFPLGILINMLGASLWYYVAKITTGKQTYMAGLAWDFMAGLPFLFLPLLLFGVKLNTINVIGLTIALFGMILMKVGG